LGDVGRGDGLFAAHRPWCGGFQVLAYKVLHSTLSA
jgi:hypothetical protein